MCFPFTLGYHTWDKVPILINQQVLRAASIICAFKRRFLESTPELTLPYVYAKAD